MISPLQKIRKTFELCKGKTSNVSSPTTTPPISPPQSYPNSPSPTPTPLLSPSPPSYEKTADVKLDIIDENITKTENGYIYSNGELQWRNGIACYVINTGIFMENCEMKIVYIFRDGKCGLKKRYGYFDNMDNFIEHELF